MEDDDKTVLRKPSADKEPSVFRDLRADPLPPGARLREFVIESTIAIGGFGIVYLAREELLGREVAIKEYLPESLAYRASDVSVRARSYSTADTFALGLRCFIKEAKTLASFDDPALVKVYQFWQQNGTAYMVMPYYRGPTLKQALAKREEPPDEPWLRGLLDALLNALEVLHKERWYHRDVAPDNILLLNGVVPVLLDFGAARRVIEDHAKTLTVILKPGYAPVEQYGEIEGLKQGPWTDLYALAAVMYMAIVGRAPPLSVSRAVRDTIQPLSELMRGRFSETFLRTIDKALSVLPSERPQSVAEFRAMLGEGTSLSKIRGSGKPVTLSPWGRRPAVAASAVTTVGILAGAIWWLGTGQAVKPEQHAQVSTPATAPAAIASASTSTTLTSASVAVGVGELASRPASAIMPAPTPTPVLAAPDTSLPPPLAQAQTQAAAPTDPLDALFEMRDPSIEVVAKPNAESVRIRRDTMRFSLTSSVAGNVYVFIRGTRDELVLLFPNRLDKRNRIEAGQRIILPSKSWTLQSGGPAGVNRFVAIVSVTPREFANSGARTVDTFLTFDEKNFPKVTSSQVGLPNPILAGSVKCGGGRSACNNAYGAARFEIHEVP